MTAGALRAATGALALVAAGISAYLVTVHFADASIACISGGGCETVQESAYSEIGPVPLSALGLAVYAALAATALFRGEIAATAAFALGISVGVFAVYLIVVQTIVLDAICVWCMTTDAIALLLVVVTALRLRAEIRLADAPPGGGDGSATAP